MNLYIYLVFYYKMNEYILISVIIIILVLLLSSVLYNKKPKIYNGVCVFDLDNTITCGIQNAKIAIDVCRNNNYKIAINTARPTLWYSDIKLDELGLDEHEFIDDFYYGKPFNCSFTDNSCLINSISETKVDHLDTISKKWNIRPKNIILFDDQYYNISKANEKGYSTVFANNPQCGLSDNIKEQIEKLITLEK